MEGKILIKYVMTMMMILVLFSTVAIAATKTETIKGNDARNHLVGTNANSYIIGYDRGDTIDDTAGNDVDTIKAGRGHDHIYVNDSQGNEDGDIVYCGKGIDTVHYNSADTLRDCERKILSE